MKFNNYIYSNGIYDDNIYDGNINNKIVKKPLYSDYENEMDRFYNNNYNYTNKSLSLSDLNYIFDLFMFSNNYIKDIKVVEFTGNKYIPTKFFIYIDESKYMTEKFISNIKEEQIADKLICFLNKFIPFMLINDIEFVYD